MTRSPRLAFAIVQGSLFVGSAAWADGKDPTAAEALFRQARLNMQQGDYEHACPKLEESQRLDPAPGTLLNLGECEEKRGRLATAWQRYEQVQDTLSPGDERADFAAARALDLAPRLPRLVVRLARSAPAGTRVQRDGIDLGAASLDTPLPVDPGPHTLVVLSPGRAARTYPVIALEGRVVETAVDAGPPDLSSARKETARTPVNRTLGFVGMGLGGTALAVGSIAGVLAVGRARAADEHCDAARTCDADGLAANRDGRTLSTVSTISFATGAVLVVGGLAWVLTR